MSESDTAPKGMGRALTTALDKAIAIQQPIVADHVRRIRDRHDGAKPKDVITRLEKQYLATVIGMGTLAGGTAAAPGVGTAAAVAVNVVELAGFMQASMLFALAVAEVHGQKFDEIEQRRTLLLALVLGDSGASLVEKTAGRTGKYWGKLLTDKIPMATITKINKVLGRWFITKYGTKQGIIVIGRLAPFGIGAGIGGAGNALFGRTVVAGARRAFGPAEEQWHDQRGAAEFQASQPIEGTLVDDTAPPSSKVDESDRDEQPEPAPAGSLADELTKLTTLHSSGDLTPAQFELAKNRLLEGAT